MSDGADVTDSMQSETVTITDEENGQRLDRVLAARLPAHSRSRLKALILAGDVSLNGSAIDDPSHHVKSRDTITLTLPPPVAPLPEAQDIPLTIVYEDDDLVVIDKQKGLVVHPAAGHESGTLVNALIAHCGASLSGIGGVRRPGIVHRLDKDTTGLMVVAKNDKAHRRLAAQFEDKTSGQLTRGYLAIVWGAPLAPRGTIDAPVGRHAHSRERQAVRAGGRAAVTHWAKLDTYGESHGKPLAALLACTLETGRTHQLRVHLSHTGHPILGDQTYSVGFKTKASKLPEAAKSALEGLGRQALHAYLLGFEHPSTGETLQFRSELPADIARLRDALAANH